MYNPRRLGWITLVAIMLLLVACSETSNSATDPQLTQVPTEAPTQESTQEPTQQPVQQPTDSMEGLPPTALEAAATVMTVLKNGDMEQLAAWVHPEQGLRFSPYPYVDLENDLVFTRDQVSALMDDSTAHVWRTFPGTGEVIELTYADYAKRFVYDADFIKDADIALNEILGEMTTLSNLNEVYPQETHDFVDYYIDVIDPAHEGMDWRSLRLVFEKIGDDRMLVGIIHDHWRP